jgi:hypothetical protein
VGQHRYVRDTEAERFWSKVERSGGPDACWMWLAGTDGLGYGRFNRTDRRRASAQIGAHRMAWLLTHDEELPPTIPLRHTCDTPGCVNPKHLFKGSDADARRDAMLKGRPYLSYVGRRTHCQRGHKLTDRNTIVQRRGERIIALCRACRLASQSRANKRYRAK